MQVRRFPPFAWGVLIFNVLVVLWGAFVRATGSGAGCGSHWPLCNGEVLPRAPQIETVIEFSHRITSGIAFLLVLMLVVWAVRAFPRGHHVRKAAIASFVLMVVESLVGAGLVLLELVAHNVSVARAFWMAGHLINTFLLLGALTLAAWWADGKAPMRLRGQGGLTAAFAAACAGMLILAASGGITALGDTLTLGAGISPEESPVVAALVRLRVSHPLIALMVGALVGLAAWMARRVRPDARAARLVNMLAALYGLQLLAGAVNVALRAPVAMQLIHLLISDLIWIVLVILAATVTAQAPAPAEPSVTALPAGRGAL